VNKIDLDNTQLTDKKYSPLQDSETGNTGNGPYSSVNRVAAYDRGSFRGSLYIEQLPCVHPFSGGNMLTNPETLLVHCKANTEKMTNRYPAVCHKQETKEEIALVPPGYQATI
jgi:hypothetical protein